MNDSQSASLSWCQAPIWDPRPIFFLREISFRQLRVCYFVAPSMTRGRVCNLLYNCFWAFPEQSLLGRSPAELTPYFTVSFETSPTWLARSTYLYTPGTGKVRSRTKATELGTGWPSYSPEHWVPFLSPLTTRRDYGKSILIRLHTTVPNYTILSIGHLNLSSASRVRTLLVDRSHTTKYVFIFKYRKMQCAYLFLFRWCV
jgi:hypothetical protein